MNILAIGCHPDDLEIGCSGTLAKYVKLGHKVIMCHVVNGNLGHVQIQPIRSRLKSTDGGNINEKRD
jgi:LmbE family N-acetylglucosaminyl deacetylase